MATYEVQISRSAERQLARLDSGTQRRIAATMLSLAKNPRPRGCRKLIGYDDVFRVRVGRYRLLYSVSDETVVIVILKVGHRRDVYR
ncbi:MAG: type II toxin-antitoxin system RelE/ParE family toxin [Acidobacteriota bacterium]|nr:type II toxin-antitoxin system RelE/ParE family toxin [Acidobacteriota bacterium]